MQETYRFATFSFHSLILSLYALIYLFICFFSFFSLLFSVWILCTSVFPNWWNPLVNREDYFIAKIETIFNENISFPFSIRENFLQSSMNLYYLCDSNRIILKQEPIIDSKSIWTSIQFRKLDSTNTNEIIVTIWWSFFYRKVH